MKFRNHTEALTHHVRFLYVVLGVLLVTLGVQLRIIYVQAKELPSLHLPADLRTASNLQPGQQNASGVYAFTNNMWQIINSWPEDGRKEYAENIFRYQCYLTPPFRRALEIDLEERGKRGALHKRRRGLHLIPSLGYEPWRVRDDGNGHWTVTLDYRLVEHQIATRVKSPVMRYTLNVVEWTAAPQCNDYGLAITSFAEGGPQRLTDEQVAQLTGEASDDQ